MKRPIGTWRIGKRVESQDVLQLPIEDRYGCIAWLVKRPQSFGSDEENGRLIVAAPELLSALEFIRADLNDPLMDFDQARIVKRYTDFINKILAKHLGDV